MSGRPFLRSLVALCLAGVFAECSNATVILVSFFFGLLSLTSFVFGVGYLVRVFDRN